MMARMLDKLGCDAFIVSQKESCLCGDETPAPPSGNLHDAPADNEHKIVMTIDSILQLMGYGPFHKTGITPLPQAPTTPDYEQELEAYAIKQMDKQQSQLVK